MQMNGIRFKLGSGIATAMSVPLLLAAPAHAQDPSDQSSASASRAQEDIVVTARNKEESILQAPLAVSSFSGETLTERNINNQDDLSLQTPGFDFSSPGGVSRSEEHTSELQSLMRISYAVFCLKKKTNKLNDTHIQQCTR